MNTAQHTPEKLERQPEWDDDDANGRGLAVGAGRCDKADILAWVTLAHGKEAAEARAHLIAAAPELLDIARRWDNYREGLLAKEFGRNSPSLTQLLDDTRAAIAKAQNQP